MRRIRRQANKRQFQICQLIHNINWQRNMFPHGHLNILQHRQRRKQRPILKKYARANLKMAHLAPAHMGNILTKKPDDAIINPLQPVQAAQQNGFTPARLADNAQHLALIDIEVQILKHHLRAKALLQMPHFNQRACSAFRDCHHHQIPIAVSAMANIASSTITKKIDFTTEART